MKNTLLIAVILSAATVASASDTLCTNQEKIIFSCSTGKKIVSVCASKDLSASAGTLQYRFGKKGAVEATVPAAAAHPKKHTNGNNLMYSGGGGAYLRFIKGNYGYVVYTGIGKGWEKEGVAVEKGGKTISNMLCRSAAQSEIGPDFFSKSGIPEDKTDFEIP